jgi:GT2 family glycosyltransferase
MIEFPKSFAIGIPTVNQFEFLQQNINALVKYLPKQRIYIYNNSKHALQTKVKTPNNAVIFESGKNVGVAASWNTMLTDMKANGYDYGLILNDDIVLSERIKEIHDYLKHDIEFARITNDWSVFLISLKVFSKVGLFDEKFFPAYFEDCDYQYRMKLKDVKVDYPRLLIPATYRTSSSIKEDPSLNENYQANRRYYIKKWGGEPFRETFKTPFNK